MEALQKYPSFAKFQTALERKRLAPTTLESYVKAIKNFAEALNLKDPENAFQVIKSQEDKERFLNDAIDTLRKTLSDTTISSTFKALRYWLRVNNVIVNWDSVIIPTGEAIVEDRIPAKEEFKSLLTIANIRDQAIALVASSSGLRLNTLLTLKVGDVNFDLPDIGRIMVKRIYTMEGKEYDTGRKISKKRKFFITFITPEARKALEAYLKWRKEEGEELTPESPLFTHIDKAKRGKFLEKHAFDVQWRRLLRKAHLDKKADGSPWNVLHFHTLKKYAETKMIDAGVKTPYMEFFLGHKGGYLEANYFRGEEEKCIEEYRKAIPNLSISEAAPRVRPEDLRRAVLEEILDENLKPYADKFGISVSEARRMLIREKKSFDDWQEMAKKFKFKKAETNGGDCGEEFEQIQESQLLSYLKAGWQIVHRLESGEVIVKRAEL